VDWVCHGPEDVLQTFRRGLEQPAKSTRSSSRSRGVLSRQTGYERPYGQNPYVGYDDVSEVVRVAAALRGGSVAA